MIIDPLLNPFRETSSGAMWFIHFDENGNINRGREIDLNNYDINLNGFFWIHMNIKDVRSAPLLKKIKFLTESGLEALIDEIDHQYLENLENLICGVLLDHQYFPSSVLNQTDYLRFAFNQKYIITAQSSAIECIEQSKEFLKKNTSIKTTSDLFELLVGFLIVKTAKISLDVNSTLDQAEDLIIDRSARTARPKLGDARRNAVRLSRQINGVVSTLERLEIEPSEAEDVFSEALNETGARLVQQAQAVTREVISIQDKARFLQDELNSMLNLRTNDQLYVLTTLTTLLLPATFVTGYFGMNTKDLLFTNTDNGSLYASAICLFVSAIILVFMRIIGLTYNRNDD